MGRLALQQRHDLLEAMITLPQAEELVRLRRALRGKTARLAAAGTAPGVQRVADERSGDIVVCCDAVLDRLARAVDAGELPESLLADASTVLRL